MMDSIISEIKRKISRYRYCFTRTKYGFDIYFYATKKRSAFSVSLSYDRDFYVQFECFCDFACKYVDTKEEAISVLCEYLEYCLGHKLNVTYHAGKVHFN